MSELAKLRAAITAVARAHKAIVEAVDLDQREGVFFTEQIDGVTVVTANDDRARWVADFFEEKSLPTGLKEPMP